MPRLFTVRVASSEAIDARRGFVRFPYVECDFAGIHFSRQHEADLIKWVRIAAKRRYGKDSQVIFLHTEGNEPE